MSSAPVSLRAAAVALGWKGAPRSAASRLLRHLRAVEARDGCSLLVPAGGEGHGRRYNVSLEVLREFCPDLFPSRREELASMLRAELAKLDERIEQVADRVELLAETVIELARHEARPRP